MIPRVLQWSKALKKPLPKLIYPDNVVENKFGVTKFICNHVSSLGYLPPSDNTVYLNLHACD